MSMSSCKFRAGGSGLDTWPQTIQAARWHNLKLWMTWSGHEDKSATVAGALRAFEVAARLQSFTRAAREIHVSQAAISLGVSLFHRAHRRVELTAAHPHIELKLETSDELRVLGRDADIAIHYVSVRRRLRLKRAMLLLRIRGTPLALDRPRTLDDRAVEGRRLLHDDGGSAWRRWFSAARLPEFERARHQFFDDYSLASSAARRSFMEWLRSLCP